MHENKPRQEQRIFDKMSTEIYYGFNCKATLSEYSNTVLLNDLEALLAHMFENRCKSNKTPQGIFYFDCPSCGHTVNTSKDTKWQDTILCPECKGNILIDSSNARTGN